MTVLGQKKEQRKNRRVSKSENHVYLWQSTEDLRDLQPLAKASYFQISFQQLCIQPNQNLLMQGARGQALPLCISVKKALEPTFAADQPELFDVVEYVTDDRMCSKSLYSLMCKPITKTANVQLLLFCNHLARMAHEGTQQIYIETFLDWIKIQITRMRASAIDLLRANCKTDCYI